MLTLPCLAGPRIQQRLDWDATGARSILWLPSWLASALCRWAQHPLAWRLQVTSACPPETAEALLRTGSALPVEEKEQEEDAEIVRPITASPAHCWWYGMADEVPVVAPVSRQTGEHLFYKGPSHRNLPDCPWPVDVVSVELRCLSHRWPQTAHAGPVNVILASGHVCSLVFTEE